MNKIFDSIFAELDKQGINLLKVILCSVVVAVVLWLVIHYCGFELDERRWIRI